MNLDLASATIVDVRTPGEFARGHHPRAINIPLGELQDRLPEFEHMQKPVIFYCRSGNRSGMAVTLLKQVGIQEVYNGGSLQDITRSTGLNYS